MGKYSLWVRESGTGDGKSATVALSADNIRSLRDGCTRLLLELGLEEEITIAIPKLAKSTRSQAENARSWAGSTPGLQD
jgi:hypothetical protein